MLIEMGNMRDELLGKGKGSIEPRNIIGTTTALYKHKEQSLLKALYREPDFSSKKPYNAINLYQTVNNLSDAQLKRVGKSSWLDELQYVISLREQVQQHYYSLEGKDCQGHRFWIELLKVIKQKILDEKNLHFISPASILSKLDIEAGRKSIVTDEIISQHNDEQTVKTLNKNDRFEQSWQETKQDVFQFVALQQILSLGERLKHVWKTTMNGEMDFITAAQGIEKSSLHY